MHAIAGVNFSNYSKVNDLARWDGSLQLTCGHVIFSSFAKSTEGWMGRKVVALPLAAVAIVKAVYHLSMSLFEGLKSTYLQDTDAKMYAFCVVRDLEEFLGHLITLFSDRIGCYLVEESAYQKMCYFLASNKIEGLSSSELEPYLQFLSAKALRKISGPQFQGLDLSRLQRRYFSEIFPREGSGSFSEETKARFAGLSVAQIQSVLPQLGDAALFELISREQLQGLDLAVLRIILQSVFGRNSDGGFSKEVKDRFSYLSISQAQSILGDLIKFKLLELISEEQLSGLDLSLLEDGDFNRMFTRGRSSGPKFTEEVQLFFPRLKAKQVQPILAKLGEHGLLELISKDQLQGLDLSSLDQGDLGALFPRDENGEVTEETKLRFSCLLDEQIQSVADNLKALGLIS